MEAAKSPNVEALEATITYLEGLPTGTSTDSAIANIDGWEEKLRTSDKPEFTIIADELQTLKKHLTSGNLDGKAISQTLISLGGNTTKAAAQADSTIAERLQKLGSWLTKLGETVG
jgi:hypothetical protein